MAKVLLQSLPTDWKPRAVRALVYGAAIGLLLTGAPPALVRRLAKVAIDLAQIAKNEATAKVKTFGDYVEVTYRPAVVSTKWQKNLQKVQREVADAPDDEAAEKAAEKVTKEFQKLIVDWDLTNNGKKLNVDTEGLDLVPIPMLNDIMGGIMEHAAGGDTEEAEDTKNG